MKLGKILAIIMISILSLLIIFEVAEIIIDSNYIPEHTSACCDECIFEIRVSKISSNILSIILYILCLSIWINSLTAERRKKEMIDKIIKIAGEEFASANLSITDIDVKLGDDKNA